MSWKKTLMGWALQTSPLGLGPLFWLLADDPVQQVGLIAVSLGLGTCFMVYLVFGDEREGRLLRLSLYGSGAVVGWVVFESHIGYWLYYLPGDGSTLIWQYMMSFSRVHTLLGPWFQFTPWGAAVLAGLGAALGLGEFFRLLVTPRNRHRRKKSQSDLYGKATLMSKKAMKKLSKSPGIILGTESKKNTAALVSYPLEGAALTIAPPRTGKTALIGLNMLDPTGKAFGGSVILIDPRGENFFVAALRRKLHLHRDVVLIDPFREIARHVADFPGQLRIPTCDSYTYNPLDFVREGPEAVGDIQILLDALLTPPVRDDGPSQHFYQASRTIIGGYIAWVRFVPDIDPAKRNLSKVRALIMLAKERRDSLLGDMIKNESVGYGMPAEAAARLLAIGEQEMGSTFSTVANQLGFLQFPEIQENTGATTFDPVTLTNGNTDIFVVVPEAHIEAVKGWLRLWITIPNALASREALRDGLLVIIDEMPRIGFLKPVMDAYNMAAGKGIRFWCFAQSMSTLETAYGRDNTRVIIDLAEVIQVMGFPRTNWQFAEDISKAIGHATYESQTQSVSGSVSGTDLMERQQSRQEGTSEGLVKERIVPTDDLLTLKHGEQYVITGNKDAGVSPTGKEAMHLFESRFWERKDCKNRTGLNPWVLRKQQENTEVVPASPVSFPITSVQPEQETPAAMVIDPVIDAAPDAHIFEVPDQEEPVPVPPVSEPGPQPDLNASDPMDALAPPDDWLAAEGTDQAADPGTDQAVDLAGAQENNSPGHPPEGPVANPVSEPLGEVAENPVIPAMREQPGKVSEAAELADLKLYKDHVECDSPRLAAYRQWTKTIPPRDSEQEPTLND